MSDPAERYARVRDELRGAPRRWLVTGAAGFIGSHLVEALLGLGQRVTGLDNFATGHRRNLDDVLARVPEGRGLFDFVEGDIRDLDTCRAVCRGADLVLHQAALGSVPRSIDDPLETNSTNVTGFLNVLVAARAEGVRRFVYAASSSTYGDEPTLPKREDRIGRPLSPYAVGKLANELYAGVFHRTYGMETVGLRYFNVFGPRQDPQGPYAAVIPLWFDNLMSGRPCRIHGDGSTTRDFCYVANVVQANLLAATVAGQDALGEVCNVAYGGRTTLNELFEAIRACAARENPDAASAEPHYGPFRRGDVLHSQADIAKARRLLGYAPTHSLAEGLEASVGWYAAAARRAPAGAGA